jgi:hypothetical protein
MKMHDLKTVIVNCIEYQYFYTREKNDANGNSRYRVYIIDADAPAVYEKIYKTYDGLIKNHVINFIEGVYNND